MKDVRFGHRGGGGSGLKSGLSWKTPVLSMSMNWSRNFFYIWLLH